MLPGRVMSSSRYTIPARSVTSSFFRPFTFFARPLLVSTSIDEYSRMEFEIPARFRFAVDIAPLKTITLSHTNDKCLAWSWRDSMIPPRNVLLVHIHDTWCTWATRYSHDLLYWVKNRGWSEHTSAPKSTEYCWLDDDLGSKSADGTHIYFNVMANYKYIF